MATTYDNNKEGVAGGATVSWGEPETTGATVSYKEPTTSTVSPVTPTKPLTVTDFETPDIIVPNLKNVFETGKETETTISKIADVAKESNIQTIDELIKTLQTPTTSETERATLTDQLKTALEEVKGKSTRLAEEEQKAGVSNMVKQLQNINQQIASTQAGLMTGIAQEEARPIARQFITGRTAEMQRQAAAELGALSLTSQAIQGNISLAQQTAQRTVDLEFAAQEQEIENVKTLLDLNYNNLTREDKKKADELNIRLAEREELIAKQKEEKTNISNLAIKAGEAGADSITIQNILSSKTQEEAILNGAGYLRIPDTTIIDIEGRKKLIDVQTGELIKDLGMSDISAPKLESIEDSFGNKIYGTWDGTTFNPLSVPNSEILSNDELSTAINTAIGTMGLSSDARKSVTNAVMSNLENGDIEAAKDALETAVRNNARVAETEKFSAWDSAYSDLEKIKSSLDEYEKMGGKTGFWKGLSEKQLEKIGRTTDTELAKIKSKIAIAIINYRKNVSGAAFTESEKTEYEQIFPSIGDTKELNDAKIESLMESFKNNKDNFIRTKVGSNAYDKIFGTTSSVSQLPPLTKSYSSIDSLVTEYPEYKTLYGAILKENPNLTDDEILKEILELSGIKSGGGATVNFNKPVSSGVKSSNKILATLSQKQNGKSGGQCGSFVNRITGIGVGDSYQSKMAKMDPNIKKPEPGMVFVMPYSWTGHIGFILDIKNGIATVKDSNWGLDEKIQTHKIPVSKLTGFRRV